MNLASVKPLCFLEEQWTQSPVIRLRQQPKPHHRRKLDALRCGANLVHPRRNIRKLVTPLRVLVRDGALAEDPEQPWLNLQDPDTLDQLTAASAQCRITIGPGAGQCTLTRRNPALAQPTRQSIPKPLTVNRDGFSLNAASANWFWESGIGCEPLG